MVCEDVYKTDGHGRRIQSRLKDAIGDTETWSRDVEQNPRGEWTPFIRETDQRKREREGEKRRPGRGARQRERARRERATDS